VSLRDRLLAEQAGDAGGERNEHVSRFKRLLLQEVDLAELATLTAEQRRARLERVMSRLLSGSGAVLSTRDRAVLTRRVVDDALGLGVLEPLLADEDITEIMVNGPRDVFVERAGRIERVDVEFADEDQLLQTIDRIVSAVNRRVDESSPMVDARLPTGERVNVIVPPLALSGPTLTIRRFPRPYRLDQLMARGSLDQPIALLLGGFVRAKLNVLVSGGTGSGKTTLLNALSGFVPPDERIITIEDAAELSLQQEHVVRLESKPANVEGKGQVTIRDLVRNSLRMRPDRIIVGEVRGGETLDMLQAMNTGHEGSLATVHANSADDAVLRLETLATMSETVVPSDTLREQINSAIDIVVHLDRAVDGSRRIVEVAMLSSRRREAYQLTTLAEWATDPLLPDHIARGSFQHHPLPRELFNRLVRQGESPPPDFGVSDVVHGTRELL
jgi:pilus assembly protein CpaF